MKNRLAITGRAPNGGLILNIIKSILMKSGLLFIEKRHKGGSLWIVDDERLTKELLDECSYEANCRFIFCRNGSRSTGHCPAWYTKVLA